MNKVSKMVQKRPNTVTFVQSSGEVNGVARTDGAFFMGQVVGVHDDFFDGCNELGEIIRRARKLQITRVQTNEGLLAAPISFVLAGTQALDYTGAVFDILGMYAVPEINELHCYVHLAIYESLESPLPLTYLG